MSVIETNRLVYHRPTKDDSLILRALWRNDKVREFLGGIVSEELIEQKIVALQNQWDLHQFGQLVVYEKKSSRIVGLCGLHYSAEGIEISYMFFPQFWGKGLAREAVIACIDYGFNILNMKVIIAITQEMNIKSCQLLDKIGMSHINTFERFNATQRLYQLIRTEWDNHVRSI